MNSKKILSIDLTQKKSFLKCNPKQAFVNLYQTKLPGRGVLHSRHAACEYKEHSLQQHGIVVHFKPERNSLRRLGDTVEIENPSVGDIAIIPSKVNHWQRIETEVSEGIILTIDPQLIPRIAYETIDPNRFELLPTFAKSDPLIYSIALNLIENLNSDCYDRLYAESLFHTLLLHLIRNYSTRQFNFKCNKEGIAPHKLKKVLNLIADRLSEDISIEDMASCIDLSPSHFCRSFKDSVGQTPHRYIMQQRVEMVKILLKDKRRSQAEIAVDCGFTHQSHMGRVFKKYTGVTPRQYRNEIGI